MRKYVFDQNSIFSFLSNKPIISGFKNVDILQLNLIMLKWKVWYIFSFRWYSWKYQLNYIRQFPEEKISCFLSGIELDDLFFWIKQIFPQLSGEFKYWAFYILSIPLILHKTWSQQEYANRDQGFSQGYSECSVGFTWNLVFPSNIFLFKMLAC